MRYLNLAVLILLSGCAMGPRQYTYDLDLKNATNEPLTFELLQAQSGNIRKSRADLAPGGSYATCFTGYGDAEYLEARVRREGSPEDAPWCISELSSGRIRADIVQSDGGFRVRPRRPTPPEPPSP